MEKTPNQAACAVLARALEIAHLAVADVAAEVADGGATLADLRKAVRDWRAAGESYIQAVRACAADDMVAAREDASLGAGGADDLDRRTRTGRV